MINSWQFRVIRGQLERNITSLRRIRKSSRADDCWMRCGTIIVTWSRCNECCWLVMRRILGCFVRDTEETVCVNVARGNIVTSSLLNMDEIYQWVKSFVCDVYGLPVLIAVISFVTPLLSYPWVSWTSLLRRTYVRFFNETLTIQKFIIYKYLGESSKCPIFFFCLLNFYSAIPIRLYFDVELARAVFWQHRTNLSHFDRLSVL